ncbi:hypothetical protein Micbo1qcDRAFT_206564 [Microdochium bolleyi]|uniref:Extracellular membrane protein CFEM domain-containing protein n=1 Tax=Microdochium bolleyi TaxID=196109 RepID=A0A136IVA9_9PEZI|nr:hypothetical protein Micbo1qcDRAFT_206564 [Microdochium bolleyi]
MLFQRTLPALLLYALHATGPAASQSTGTDYILLVTDPNYTDLSQCAQTCLQCTAFDCSSVVTESQCTTNKCLCRPSYLGTALNFAYTCVKDRCKDLSDAQAAQDTYKAYCAAKGYTSVLAPEGTTGTASVSYVTVTQTVTALGPGATSGGSVSPGSGEEVLHMVPETAKQSHFRGEQSSEYAVNETRVFCSKYRAAIFGTVNPDAGVAEPDWISNKFAASEHEQQHRRQAPGPR